MFKIRDTSSPRVSCIRWRWQRTMIVVIGGDDNVGERIMQGISDTLSDLCGRGEKNNNGTLRQSERTKTTSSALRDTHLTCPTEHAYL